MSNYQSDQIKLINTSLIDPHPDNPRKQIGDVTDLAASIKANGLLSPLSVVPNGERYRVIAGIKPEQALAELHTHLDSPDWPTYAVMILTARIEWFISPNDWDWSGDDNVSRRIPGYYLILQDLGYEPSDDETEHLDQLVAAITEEDEEEDE